MQALQEDMQKETEQSVVNYFRQLCISIKNSSESSCLLSYVLISSFLNICYE